MKRVLVVAAVARNGVIGHGPDIPWRVPGEQALFKELTLGHVLVMGRTTYESIGRPLPGRTTVVLTRDPTWTPGPDAAAAAAGETGGVVVARGLLDALARASSYPGEVVVAGGAQVYAEALPLASELVLSEIPLKPEGDAFFPAVDPAVWEVTDRESFPGFDRVWYGRAG